MTKTKANLSVLSTLVIATGSIGAACAGTAPAPSAPSEVASISVPPSATTASAPAAPAPAELSSAPVAPAGSTPPVPASVLTTDAGTIQRLFDDTRHAAPATLKPKGTTSADPLAKGLRDLAKNAAPGMEPDGPLASGSLKEKQNIQTDITLQPGKCYAILGFSNKVKDLDLYLLLPPGILSGQDLTDDNVPVIGGPPQPMCPVATTPVTYKLDIVADQGAGEVAVQLYSKAH